MHSIPARPFAAQPDPWAGLPPAIIERLAAAGVCSAADWRALGRRRLGIWGITRRIVRELDELARGTPR